MAQVARARQRPEHVGPELEARCANCETLLGGEFCAECGQRARDLQRPFGQLAAEALEHAFSLDTKLVRTLRPLLLVPGEVTRTYLAGRRVRYVPPLRAYLVAALLFFGLFSVFPARTVDVQVVVMGSAEEAALKTQPSSGSRATFSLPAHSAVFDDAYQQALARAQQNPQAFARAAYGTIPRLFFLFLPMFALLLELFYRKQGFYFEHLVFSLYYHAFVFLCFAALFLIGRSDGWMPTFVAAPARLVIGIWLLAYLPLALRRVYGGSWRKTMAKLFGLGVLYLIGTFMIGAPLMVAWAILTF